MTDPGPTLHRVRTLLGVPVRMRDGVRLSTDVYLPDAPGPFPVILIRTPYLYHNWVYTGGAFQLGFNLR